MYVIILGAPGSGKGTQSAELIKHFSLTHLSTGDMLRQEIENKTDLGLIAKTAIDDGKLVSDEIILGMVEKQIQSQPKDSQGILFDGFPRTINQAKELDNILKKNNKAIHKTVLLDVNEEEIVTRMLARGRSDDNEETIRNRLVVYKEQTLPLIDYYKNQDKLYSISGSGDINKITKSIQDAIAS